MDINEIAAIYHLRIEIASTLIKIRYPWTAFGRYIWLFAINNNNCQFAVRSAVKPSIIAPCRTSQYVSPRTYESIISAIFTARKLVAIPIWFTITRHRPRNAPGKWLHHRVSNSLAIVSPLSANPPRALQLVCLQWLGSFAKTTGQPYEILS